MKVFIYIKVCCACKKLIDCRIRTQQEENKCCCGQNECETACLANNQLSHAYCSACEIELDKKINEWKEKNPHLLRR